MAEPKLTTLYSLTNSKIKLQEALNQYAQYFTSATALLYSPEDCKFAQFEDGRLNDCLGEIPTAKLDRVFEVRLFNQDYELRWLNQERGSGTVAILWDCNISSSLKDAPANQLEAIHTFEQTYILWGEGTGASLPKGWSRLAAARIGKLEVPLAGIVANQQVQLKVKEYLKVFDHYGNVAIVEERLLALEPILSGSKEKKNGNE